MTVADPHRAAKVYQSGPELRDAAGVLLLLHGRGGSASDILSLGREFAPENFALIAPQGTPGTPPRFLLQFTRTNRGFSHGPSSIPGRF